MITLYEQWTCVLYPTHNVDFSKKKTSISLLSTQTNKWKC